MERFKEGCVQKDRAGGRKEGGFESLVGIGQEAGWGGGGSGRGGVVNRAAAALLLFLFLHCP